MNFAILLEYAGQGNRQPIYIPRPRETVTEFVQRIAATETEQTGKVLDPLIFRLSLVQVDGPLAPC